MRTNYPGHEAGYRSQKERGAAGWNTAEDAYLDWHEHFQKLIDDGSWPEKGDVLELGCGAGNTSVWLAKKGYKVVGVDISPTAIEWAKERASGERVSGKFLLGDVLHLDGLDGDYFDLALDSHCLHCIIGEDRKRFLTSAFRALKPGGILWIETMSEPVNPEVIEDYDPDTQCIMTGAGAQRFAGRFIGSKSGIETEVTQAGFNIDASTLDPQDDSPEDGCGILCIRASKPIA